MILFFRMKLRGRSRFSGGPDTGLRLAEWEGLRDSKMAPQAIGIAQNGLENGFAGGAA
jgi:hypothetical protein